MMDRGWARLILASALTMGLIGAAAAQQSPAQQTPDDITQLKAQVQQLQQQLQALSKKLDEAVARKTDAAAGDKVATSETAAPQNSAADDATAADKRPARPLIASTEPMIVPPVTRPSALRPPTPSPTPYYQVPPPAPLQIHIGDAYITPIGFMDFTLVGRTTNNGGSIGSNFASIPYDTIFQTNLSEYRESMQNSRIGFRVDAMVHDYHVIGYFEGDFLGNNPSNVLVSSNSNTFRSRVYWVDATKRHWEILGGQTWSLITPGRVGISPLPADIFYTLNIDTNYQAGLVWGRIPELRLVYHTSDKKAHFAIAIDNPEQYVGGSAGGPVPTFPALLSTYPGGQLNNGTTTTAVPNLAPDVIAKVAFDPVKAFHIEFGGLERTFRVWNPNNLTHYNAQGAGGFLNFNFEMFKGLRMYVNTFWSDGGGRYIFGQVPDLIARANGSLSPIHAGSTVAGPEYTHKNTQIYAYYGGIYADRNFAFDANGKTLVGYGFTGSSSSNNRTIQEITFGAIQTLFRDPKWGGVQLMFQYSYVQRNPWFVVVGQPTNANINMFFGDLRWVLPGSAPTYR